MCTVCGCSQPAGESNPIQTLHFGQGPAGSSLPGISQTRTVTLEKNILGTNNRIAEQNRAHFKAHGIRALNLLSSPGSGKTTLLCKTLEELKRVASYTQAAVIEGDQQSALDAERIKATGAPVVQVNTGKGCHLDARMVADAFSTLHTHGQARLSVRTRSRNTASTMSTQTWHFQPTRQILFIENVGNLVCPALWDLGEEAKIVILSVTEGEDKPLKYPDMFQRADLLLINKMDLLPHVDFNPERALHWARSLNPDLPSIQVSATTGEGLSVWVQWLLEGRIPDKPQAPVHATLADRIKTLEAALAAARAQLHTPH